MMESMQNFTVNLLVIKYSLSERFCVTYTRNTEVESWHALREWYEEAIKQLKKTFETQINRLSFVC
jgi:hypothetical protein